MTASASTWPVQPGSWLGMVGGGQLGRMFCHAAQSLGYKVAVLDPAAGCPAGVVADRHIQASYDDLRALDELGRLCAAVSTEFENVPADSLRRLAQHCPVSPSGDAVAVVQDRIQEKAFITQAGVPVAPYQPVLVAADLQNAPDTLFPGILKAARLGYDGKGQARVSSREQALDAFAAFGSVPCVLEAMLPLADEISVVMARGHDDHCVVYTPAHNEHRDGILAVSSVDPVPAESRQALYVQAAQAAQKIAIALNYRGVLCVEFFVLDDGRLVANEVAPRPHNSGHHTIDACITSQFEQQVRVMAGMPLGSTISHDASIMLNILGDLWFDAKGNCREPDWAGVLRADHAKLHLYGKAEARKGRKMGHVTITGATLDEARQQASQVAQALGLAFS
jgi:5-(carboxyamino)imidazole ribonucleotide synthase